MSERQTTVDEPARVQQLQQLYSRRVMLVEDMSVGGARRLAELVRRMDDARNVFLTDAVELGPSDPMYEVQSPLSIMAAELERGKLTTVVGPSEGAVSVVAQYLTGDALQYLR